ncbi:threonine synthase [Paenibacillus sp. GP183]|uniref:threonine synthase n=1 Tax=Paenibacillus sp. GP183 TaxID=1882751 RepID=UPI0008979573|nr:threonine synthase [Paenibacillus sp. GP183]SEC45022.1 threonine synthase [Paenibacillus sp. GP183]
MRYICTQCQKLFVPNTSLWRCECGGLLDLEQTEISLDLELIRQRPNYIWRYREALPFSKQYEGWSGVTMGEGGTPIVPLSSQQSNILLKMDYMMPTLSFKDRGAAVLVAKAVELGVRRMIADSSGNAGTSIAAYANRAGIDCDIYVPENTSSKKIKQIRMHGANVHVIPGSRENTAQAAIDAVQQNEAFYASHVYNPFFYQGTKTYAYEIWEQLGEPDVLIVPVGNGTLLLGAYYGFKDLLRLGLIRKLPKLVAIQAERCAPIAAAFQAQLETAVPVVNSGTAAEGIAIADPPRSRQILAAIRETGGVVVTVPETMIGEAREALARYGFYVEPTTAANYAGYLEYAKHFGPVGEEKIVIPLCGAGLKAD